MANSKVEGNHKTPITNLKDIDNRFSLLCLLVTKYQRNYHLLQNNLSTEF